MDVPMVGIDPPSPLWPITILSLQHLAWVRVNFADTKAQHDINENRIWRLNLMLLICVIYFFIIELYIIIWNMMIDQFSRPDVDEARIALRLNNDTIFWMRRDGYDGDMERRRKEPISMSWMKGSVAALTLGLMVAAGWHFLLVLVGVGDLPGSDGRRWRVYREAVACERVKRAFGVFGRMKREKAQTTRRWMKRLQPLGIVEPPVVPEELH